MAGEVLADNDKIPKLGDRVRQRIYARWGVGGLVGIALFGTIYFAFDFVLTHWNTLRTWPIVSSFVGYFGEESLPKADPARLSVAVAHLEDDTSNDHKELIVRLLWDFDGIQVLDFDRTISVKGPVPEEAERQGHQTARKYLKQGNASVLIWGRILSYGTQTRPDLYLTAQRGGVEKSKQYAFETGTEFRLPNVFWDDLSDVLRLVITTQDAQFWAQEGHYVADRLTPFIERVRNLLKASVDRPGWDANALGSTRVILANALQSFGKQSGQNEPPEEAISTYRAALEDYSRERVPLNWATIQNNLGNALLTLGERESGTKHLEDAVAAYCAALEESTRERVPLNWAAAQNNLGNALLRLGERESGTKRLEDAVAAYRAALEERSRERVPLRWAETQNNLGGALWILGARESGTARLEEAVAAYRASLEERTRERVPLRWAETQDNLGSVLIVLAHKTSLNPNMAILSLRDRRQGIRYLDQAVLAFRAALQETDRKQVPLQWASAQWGLGSALASLGEWKPDKEVLTDAVLLFRSALEEYDRERVPFEWMNLQTTLCRTLKVLGQREDGTKRLAEAVATCRLALKEVTREQATISWAVAKNNLGQALWTLGDRQGNAKLINEAQNHIIAAYQVFNEVKISAAKAQQTLMFLPPARQ